MARPPNRSWRPRWIQLSRHPENHDGQGTPDGRRLVPDAFRALRVEKIDRADGSYVLYFTWTAAPAGNSSGADPPDPDV